MSSAMGEWNIQVNYTVIDTALIAGLGVEYWYLANTKDES